MPIRKPPCVQECERRNLYCHSSCPEFAKYKEQMQKDKDAKMKYYAEHSDRTHAKEQALKAVYRQKN